MLPSDKADLKAKEKARIAAEVKDQADHLRIIMNGCFQSPDGILVLKWLAQQCSFGKPIQILDDRSMMLGVIKHNLYTEIRRNLTPEIIAKVEL